MWLSLYIVVVVAIIVGMIYCLISIASIDVYMHMYRSIYILVVVLV